MLDIGDICKVTSRSTVTGLGKLTELTNHQTKTHCKSSVCPASPCIPNMSIPFHRRLNLNLRDVETLISKNKLLG